MERKRYDASFKKRVVNEALETGNRACVARRHGVSPASLNRWVKQLKEDGDPLLGSHRTKREGARGPSIEDQQKVEKENEQLKKLLGEKDLEIAILRDLLKKGSHL